MTLCSAVHHYDYTGNGWDPSIYPVPRFTSEFGFQAWPSFTSLANVSVASDWDVISVFTSHRQHHTDGETRRAQNCDVISALSNAQVARNRVCSVLLLLLFLSKGAVSVVFFLWKRPEGQPALK